MKRFLLAAMPLMLVLAAVLGAIACGSARFEPAPSTTPATVGESPVPPSTTLVAPGATPSESTPESGVSVDDLMAIGNQTLPLVAQFGYYGVCGQDGDTSACPYTERLKARLAEAQATLCRCQNSSTTRAMSAEVTDFGGILYVALYDGSQSFTLTVLDVDGRLLVDDQVCMGRGPETSIHVTVAACH